MQPRSQRRVYGAEFKTQVLAECRQPDASVAAVANKYADQADAKAYLAGKIRAGGSGVWGEMPMPAQSHLSEEDLNALSDWFLSKKK